jgi:selenocysteine lyase/cysteine desulfurase
MSLEPEEARSLFPITDHYIHMNHAGVSPMSDRGRAAIEQVVEDMTSRPPSDRGSFDEAERLRGLIGELLNAVPETISLTRSTAHGMSLLAQGLEWREGDNVVGAEWEYPANVMPWLALEGRGVEYRAVKPAGGRVTPEAVLALIDSRTRVVALSHVQFWNGYRIDLKPIGDECRRRGIVFAVDVMQSLGALRVDVEATPIDFCAAGAGKWLLGPPGVGFCFGRPELIGRLQPRVVGAASMKDVNYFEPKLEFPPSARRFEESVVSRLDMAAFAAAVELILEVGPDVIENRVLELSARLAGGLAERGYELIEPWPRAAAESSGIVSFRKPGATAQEVLRDLNSAQIVARIHRDFVRLSPHFYNTHEEVDRVLGVLAPESVNR